MPDEKNYMEEGREERKEGGTSVWVPN